MCILKEFGKSWKYNFIHHLVIEQVVPQIICTNHFKIENIFLVCLAHDEFCMLSLLCKSLSLAAPSKLSKTEDFRKVLSLCCECHVTRHDLFIMSVPVIVVLNKKYIFLGHKPQDSILESWQITWHNF